jgi:SAM-dependent methyltransferase
VPVPPDPYRAANYRNWQARVPIHAASRDYGVERLAREPGRLSGVVAYDAARLGRLDGLDVVHLQCHIGTDTVSLARLGARSVTGYDFSPDALEVARRLAADAALPVDFVEGELYDAAEHLGTARFDLVYTGVGALNWLPSVARWARVVAALLRPGGRLFLREGHPMLSALDDERSDDLLVVEYPYFEQPDAPNRWDTPDTYTDGEPLRRDTVTYEWNHGLGEVVTALLAAGLVVDALAEHTECEWQALPTMVQRDGGRWTLPERPQRLPLMYTVQAHQP